MGTRHLSQRDLADRWGMSQATLERWRSEKIGPAYLKLRSRVVYRLEDIEHYERNCLREGDTASNREDDSERV